MTKWLLEMPAELCCCPMFISTLIAYLTLNPWGTGRTVLNWYPSNVLMNAPYTQQLRYVRLNSLNFRGKCPIVTRSDQVSLLIVYYLLPSWMVTSLQHLMNLWWGLFHFNCKFISFSPITGWNLPGWWLSFYSCVFAWMMQPPESIVRNENHASRAIPSTQWRSYCQ